MELNKPPLLLHCFWRHWNSKLKLTAWHIWQIYIKRLNSKNRNYNRTKKAIFLFLNKDRIVYFIFSQPSVSSYLIDILQMYFRYFQGFFFLNSNSNVWIFLTVFNVIFNLIFYFIFVASVLYFEKHLTLLYYSSYCCCDCTQSTSMPWNK